MPSLYIDGKWTAGSGGSADVLNPFDASVVEAVDQAGPDDVAAAVAAARAAFDDPRGWRATPVAERAGVLRRVADLLQRDREHIARVETLDTGKTLGESRIDIDDVTAVFRYYADIAVAQEGRTVDVGQPHVLSRHRARAGRRLRADHAVELPAPAAVVEARARPRGGLHVRDQAERGHAAHVGAARAARRGGGRAAGRGQHPAGHRPGGRRAAHRAPRTSTWSASPAASPPGRRSSGRRPRP